MADLVVYFIKQFVNVVVTVLHVAMFIRAILSWVDPMGEGKLSSFLFVLTEPVISPVRALCAKMHWFEGVPIDVPFLIAWLLLTVIQSLVGML